MTKKLWEVPQIESLDIANTLHDVAATGAPDGLLQSPTNPVPAGWMLES